MSLNLSQWMFLATSFCCTTEVGKISLGQGCALMVASGAAGYVLNLATAIELSLHWAPILSICLYMSCPKGAL